jgi:hypothetical protein
MSVETGVTAGSCHWDALLANIVREAEIVARERGSHTLTGAESAAE